MKSFQFKDLMINVAPAGQRELFCGFGVSYGCGYSCYHNTCPAVTCVDYTCSNFSCHIANSHCYIYTIPRVQAEQAAMAQPAAGAAQFAAGAAGAGAAGAQLCAFQTGHPCLNFTCGYITNPCRFFTCHFGCSIWITEICRTGPTFIACQFATCLPTVVDPITIQVDPESVASQLAAVKAHLQQEMAAVEKQEQTVSEALRPQTVTDVEELQGKLREAIAELDKRKQELHGGSERHKRSK